jgi:hypothetical protein
MLFQINQIKKVIGLPVIVILFVSCFQHFYKVKQAHVGDANQKASVIDSLNNQNRYFILRSGSQSFYMRNISLSADRTTVQCVLDSLSFDHMRYVTVGNKSDKRYKPKDQTQAGVLSEVHLYITPDPAISTGHYVLHFDSLKKIEIIQKDNGRTVANYVISTIGVAAGTLLFAGVIIAATKSSCPFVSAYTGNEFELQGEIYGGAIYPQLARDDYMPLRMQPKEDGTLMLKISNELKEKQYTDFADLVVVSHKTNAKVLPDANGNLYSISNPDLPQKAWTTNRSDIIPLINKYNDDQMLRFDDTLTASNDNYLIAQFKNESHSKRAKLVVSAKNSYWIDYLYGEVAKEFGDYYATYAKKQTKKPAAELLKWAQEQHLALTVSLKTKSGWQKVADLNTIGPLAVRQLVVPLDLSNVSGDNIQVKLSSGFMFWEIDYTAIDFSDDKYFSVQTISPSTATDESGKDVLPVLLKKDNNFLEQPVPGNVVTLEYKCNSIPGDISRSYILHTRGYYTHTWNFKGSPHIAFLKQLKKPNALPKYSLDEYKKYVANNMQSLVKE